MNEFYEYCPHCEENKIKDICEQTYPGDKDYFQSALDEGTLCSGCRSDEAYDNNRM